MYLFLSAFLAIFLFIVAILRRGEETKEALYEQITGEEIEKPSSTRRRSIKLKSPLTYAMKIATQAGMKPSRGSWTTILVVLPVVGFFMGRAIGLDGMGTFLLMVAVFLAPFGYLHFRRRKYLDAFRYGLQDLTEFGMSTFQVASDVDMLLEDVVRRSKNKVLVTECAEILHQAVVFGKPSLQVLEKRAEESGVPEYFLLAKMTRVGLDNNAKLEEIYKDMNTTIRGYYGTEKKILAKTDGMRKLGYVLAVLPIPSFYFFWPTISPLLVGGMKVFFYFTLLLLALGIYTLMKVVRVRV